MRYLVISKPITMDDISLELRRLLDLIIMEMSDGTCSIVKCRYALPDDMKPGDAISKDDVLILIQELHAQCHQLAHT